MLDANLKAQLAACLERMTQPVDIVASLDDSVASADLKALLQDIADASPRVTVIETRGGPQRAPSFSVNRPGEANGPRFAGLPMGHEFTSLVLALLQVGGYPPKVDEAVLRQIRDLEGDFEFEIYISARRDAGKIAAKAPFDVLIVGGAPAGAAAAVYAARKGIRTGIASERFGGQVLDTLGIENFVSVKETEGPRFALALEEHVRHYDVDIMNRQRAKALAGLCRRGNPRRG